MDKRLIIVLILAVGVVFTVAYIYRDKLKKALAQPQETLVFLQAELEEFFASEETKKIIGMLCRAAENLVSGTGEDRLAFAVGKLYEFIPDYLQTVVTVEKLQKVVTLVYEEIKVYVNGHWVAGEEG